MPTTLLLGPDLKTYLHLCGSYSYIYLETQSCDILAFLLKVQHFFSLTERRLVK